MSVSPEHESNCLVMLNEMLGHCGVSGKLESIADVTSDVFVLLHETLLEDPLLDVIRNPQTLEDEARNCQCAIDALSFDILKIHLNHVRGEDIVLGDKLAMCNLIEIYFVLLQQLDSEAEITSDELSNGFVSAADQLPLLPSDDDKLGKTSQQHGTEGSPQSKNEFSPALPPTTPQQRGKAPISGEFTSIGNGMKELAGSWNSAVNGSTFHHHVYHHRIESFASQTDKKVQFPTPAIEPRIKPRCAIKAQSAFDESPEESVPESKQVGTTYTDTPLYDISADDGKPTVAGKLISVQTSDKSDTSSVNLAQTLARQIHDSVSDRPYLDYEMKYNTFPAGHNVPEIGRLGMFEDITSTSGEDANYIGFAKRSLRGKKRSKSRPKKTIKTTKDRPSSARPRSAPKIRVTMPSFTQKTVSKSTVDTNSSVLGRSVGQCATKKNEEGKGRAVQTNVKPFVNKGKSAKSADKKACRPRSKHDHTSTDGTLPTGHKQSSSSTADKGSLSKKVVKEKQENLPGEVEPNNEKSSSNRRATYTIVNDTAHTTGELEDENELEVSTKANSNESLSNGKEEKNPHQFRRKQKTIHQTSVLYPRARTTKGRRRSASASPSVGRRNLSRDNDVIKKDQLSLMMDDFPFLHMSPSTVHRLYQDQSRHLEVVKRITHDTALARCKAKRIMDEAEYREVLLCKVLHREQQRNANIQAKKLREAEQRRVRNKLWEHRQQSTRLHHYYNEYQVRLRAKMLKQRTREEMMFKRLFNEALNSEKERLLEMRKYAKDRADERNRMKIGHGLLTLYHDQLAMLAERVADERERLVLREKAQVKAMKQMKVDLRQSLEAEIRGLQEQIVNDAEDTHFRELDMDVARERHRYA